MLDDEKAERVTIANEFQSRMSAITEEINKVREQRNAEIEKNAAIRQKITDKVAEYRKEEESYQKNMSGHQKKVDEIQKRM